MANAVDGVPRVRQYSWAETQLRKTEKKEDSVSTFKRRIIAVCEASPESSKLVPSMAMQMRECVKRHGANIGM